MDMLTTKWNQKVASLTEDGQLLSINNRGILFGDSAI